MSSRAWVTTLEDGRTNYKFHQSWLGDTDLCLERARLGLNELLPVDSSDANCVGSAVHAGIEACLHDIQKYDSPLDGDGQLRIAHETFDELIEEDGFRWVKRNEGQARQYIDVATNTWRTERMPRCQPEHVELYVGPFTIHEDEHRRIQLAGSIDYVDKLTGLEDWKTGSSEYKRWEKQRWAIQPTTYTWLYDQYVTSIGQDNAFAENGIHPFTYTVLLDMRSGRMQQVHVDRDRGDWTWLAHKALSVCKLIEAELDAWPRNDTHALCSAKWCPAWAMCKGAHVSSDWPR